MVVEEREHVEPDVAVPDGAPSPERDDEGAEKPVTLAESFRPLLVACLPAVGAGLMAGGIFGSWTARLIGAGAAVVGVGYAFLTVRSRNRIAYQIGLLPFAFVLGAVALVPTKEGPTGILGLMGDAVQAGRLLRPPVPFDAGWRPLLTLVFVTTAFAAAWVALALRRPQLGLLLPVPILVLTAISQPGETEVLGSILGFMPVLLALGVLFGGDIDRSGELGNQFEVRRLVRSVPMAGAGLALLLVISQTDFLFPEPVYDPTEKPQKPKSIPLGEVEDRVLFEIEGELTGPWRMGALDVYDGTSWRLPPFDPDRFERLPGDGVVDQQRLEDVTVRFMVRDIGDSSVLPGVPDPVRVDVDRGGVVYDPRVRVLRMGEGRVPEGLAYTQTLPEYPLPDQLRSSGPQRDAPDDFTEVPSPPSNIATLLDQAPSNPWDRLEFLRKRLNEQVVAVGAGNPAQPVPPSKVDDLVFGSHEGSPYEIVAAEALLARWAGWPARIGFGFDGFNTEDGAKTIRPKNGSNWLEIMVQGAGWVPIIGAPPKAKSTLDTDPNARFDPTIVPSDDVAVELLIPVKIENLRQLYENIRAILLSALPFLGALVVAYLVTPAVHRFRRRRKRRRWAEREGPRAEVAVAYAELRDALFDLNVGDPYDTPLEYLQRCVDDDEHDELAWLVTRATYGDLAFGLDGTHAEAAGELAESVRRRMFAAQPLQSRVLAWLSRASLRSPYTSEVPNVSLVRLRPTRRRSSSRRRTRTGAPIRTARALVPSGRS